MIKLSCYQCDCETMMKEYEPIYTFHNTYHFKWSGICENGHVNEYIDFTREYCCIGLNVMVEIMD